MKSTNVSTDQLRRALQIKQQIETLESQLSSLLSGAPTIRRQGTRMGGRRTMSASARARIAAAQRARWAKAKGTSSSNGNAPGKRRKKMSAAGRAAIAAAQRARWARKKAGK